MFSNGMVYLGASVLTQAINLILIPLYTRNLSQEQYGQYDLILSVQQLLAIAITLGVYSGMIRFFNELEDKSALKNTAMTFSLLWGALCIGLACLINPWLSAVLFNQVPEGHLFIPLIVISSVLVCLNTIYSSYYSMGFKAVKSAGVQLSAFILILLYAICFFLILDMGIVGILLAQMCGHLTVFLCLFALDLRNYKPMLKREPLRKMLWYGTGLLLGELSAWILTLSDRFLIQGFMSLSSLAIYSIGYKIGMLIQPVFINPFTSVFTPFKFKVYKEEDGAERIRRMFRLYNFIGWFCVAGLALFAKIAVALIATKEYGEAAYLVPMITLSYFLSGAIAFYSLGLHIANKVRLNSMITIGVACFNVAANLLLIPRFGIYGSAVSTVLAYAMANGAFYYFGSKHYPLGLGLLYPYKYLIVFGPVYGLYLLVTGLTDSVIVELLLNAVLCGLFVLLSLVFKLISLEEITGVLTRPVFRGAEKLAVKGVHSES